MKEGKRKTPLFPFTKVRQGIPLQAKHEDSFPCPSGHRRWGLNTRERRCNQKTRLHAVLIRGKHHHSASMQWYRSAVCPDPRGTGNPRDGRNWHTRLGQEPCRSWNSLSRKVAVQERDRGNGRLCHIITMKCRCHIRIHACLVFFDWVFCQGCLKLKFSGPGNHGQPALKWVIQEWIIGFDLCIGNPKLSQLVAGPFCLVLVGRRACQVWFTGIYLQEVAQGLGRRRFNDDVFWITCW